MSGSISQAWLNLLFFSQNVQFSIIETRPGAVGASVNTPFGPSPTAGTSLRLLIVTAIF